nr:hypothetical protein [Rhodocaloribacter litoris]
MSETSPVSGVSAAATCSGATAPEACGRSSVTGYPSRARRSAGCSTASCSAAEVISPVRSPPSNPARAALSDSVPPLVNRISAGSASRQAATRSRLSSTAKRAFRPSACTDEAFPKCSRKYGSIASKTAGSSGVVAA